MNVLNTYETTGKSNGKTWHSRTAVCLDKFKSNDGEGEYIRIFKLASDCFIPCSDDDVRPLFDEHGKVADWVSIR